MVADEDKSKWQDEVYRSGISNTWGVLRCRGCSIFDLPFRGIICSQAIQMDTTLTLVTYETFIYVVHLFIDYVILMLRNTVCVCRILRSFVPFTCKAESWLFLSTIFTVYCRQGWRPDSDAHVKRIALTCAEELDTVVEQFTECSRKDSNGKGNVLSSYCEKGSPEYKYRRKIHCRVLNSTDTYSSVYLALTKTTQQSGIWRMGRRWKAPQKGCIWLHDLHSAQGYMRWRPSTHSL